MMPPRNNHAVPRRENRIPMEIPVVLDGHRQVPVLSRRYRNQRERGTSSASAAGTKIPSLFWHRAPENFVLQPEWPTVNLSVATAT
jgi:hypothetical protein